MGVVDGYSPSTLQFVVDALRTMSTPTSVDLTMESDRRKISTIQDTLRTNGRQAIRNADGTGMTIAQIATAANLTAAQVRDIAGRI